MKKEFLECGKIVSTHGVRGEVRVQPWCDTPDFLEQFDTLWTGRGRAPVHVQRARAHGNIVILKLSGIDSMDDAEKLRGADLYVERADAVPLSEGEYYIGDIIGMKAVAEDGTELGIIRDVIDTAANDVYAVRREGRKDLLIPAIKQCIKAVDLERNMMTVHLIDGLLDL